MAIVLVATGDNFESANAAVMYQARNMIRTCNEIDTQLDADLPAIQGDLQPEWIENWYDGLGFCASSAYREPVLNIVADFSPRHLECSRTAAHGRQDLQRR
jgi:hypothetical protein